MANANAVSERAALNATFKAKPPFSSLMAASITKSIAGIKLQGPRSYSVDENKVK